MTVVDARMTSARGHILRRFRCGYADSTMALTWNTCARVDRRCRLPHQAAYKTTGGSVVSSFQRDQSLIRAKLLHDLVVRHQEAIAIKTGVTWGS